MFLILQRIFPCFQAPEFEFLAIPNNTLSNNNGANYSNEDSWEDWTEEKERQYNRDNDDEDDYEEEVTVTKYTPTPTGESLNSSIPPPLTITAVETSSASILQTPTSTPNKEFPNNNLVEEAEIDWFSDMKPQYIPPARLVAQQTEKNQQTKSSLSTTPIVVNKFAMEEEINLDDDPWGENSSTAPNHKERGKRDRKN